MTIDRRIPVIAVLTIVACVLSYYRHTHPSDPETQVVRPREEAVASFTPARVRSIIDTTAKLMGVPKKHLAYKVVDDSGRSVPEASIGVPAAFDELHLITALTDSLRPAGLTVGAAKSLKEKTTSIRITDRDHLCIYRCLLYRKELSH